MIFRTILILSLVAFLNCKKAQNTTEEPAVVAAAKAEGEAVKLNVEKSEVKWTGAKVTGKHNGTVKLKEGTIYSKDGVITAGSFVIDLTTITNTDLEGEWKTKLEGHLKSAEFFDVEKNPEAKFEITSVESGTETKINGNLSVKGIARAISIPATVTLNDKKQPTSAKAKITINRQRWGLTYAGKADDLIKDDVEFELNLETAL